MPELKDIKRMLYEQGYITDDSVAMSVFLSLQLNKPLLIEGPAGVGKTEIAKVMANALQTDLIRLQCYEGLDATHALYEWNYQRQLLHKTGNLFSKFCINSGYFIFYDGPFFFKVGIINIEIQDRFNSH